MHATRPPKYTLQFFVNLPIKHKLILNMILAQLGFSTITFIAIFSHSQVTALIVINIFFSLIIAYTNWATYVRINGGIQRFKKYMDEIMDFAFMRINRIGKAKFMKNDEIGMILKEMNSYVDKFLSMRNEDMKVLGEVALTLDKMAQGIYQCRIHATSNNFMIAALRDSLNKTLDISEKNIKKLKDTVEAYESNDFRNPMQIGSRMKGDMLAVMKSVNALGSSLGANAKKDLANGKQIQNNATTMTESVDNLSTKANEQAASLEETAQSIEQVTTIIRNNTTNTSKMNELGFRVKEEVTRGMQLATQTSFSMDQINTEVNAISKALIIIDKISFQTNILSLNAAVEAATAGEAGKGFAVVAQEVRNLASRSAHAANEIKTLVEKATQKANEGKTVSDAMIKGYNTLNENFSQTISLIESVSADSKQQMSGIEQINDSMTLLDTVTQENAKESHQVAQIANALGLLAKALVQDASAKKFE